MKNFVHVAFEGIDGSGKSSQIALIEAHLKQGHRSVFTNAEPSKKTELGKHIREQFFAKTLTEPEMQVLFAAERLINTKIWMPQVSETLGNDEESTVVILGDRSVLSALAYNDIDERDQKLLCPESTFPDYCILLDIDPEVAWNRLSQSRRTRDRWETIERMTKARERYHEIVATRMKDRFGVIDAHKSVFAIADEVMMYLVGWGV